MREATLPRYTVAKPRGRKTRAGRAPPSGNPLSEIQVKINDSIGGIYYGWVVVAAFIVLYGTVFGMYSSFGVFFKPLSAELELSRTVASVAPSLTLLFQYISALFWGLWADRWGALAARPRITGAG